MWALISVIFCVLFVKLASVIFQDIHRMAISWNQQRTIWKFQLYQKRINIYLCHGKIHFYNSFRLLNTQITKIYKHVETGMGKLFYKNSFVNGISLYSKYYLFLYSFFQKKEIQLSNKYLTTACPSHNGSHHASFICRTNSI